jgi:hypothetical protein
MNPSHSNADRLALIKQKMQAFAEPFASTFEAIPADTRVYNGGIRYWKTVPWNNYKGKITLAGDAVHPLPPCKLLLCLPSSLSTGEFQTLRPRYT